MSTRYVLGGKALGGMDAGGGDVSVAENAQNLWRAPDGCIEKRRGVKWVETLLQGAKILGYEVFGAWEYFYTADTLYRRQGQTVQSRVCQVLATEKVGDKLMLFTRGAWLMAEEGGKLTLITPDGTAVITNDFARTTVSLAPSDKTVYVPLIRAATSPRGKGKAVLPQNLVSPLVRESFVYSASDKEAKRNRFCLAVSPKLKGEIPTGELTDALAETKKSILSQSAVLELRLEQTDEFGNITHYWKKHSWTANDNINAADAAFWIASIHQKELSFDGDDNVRITYFSDDAERKTQAHKLFESDVFALYGVAGLKDRLFAASGNRIRYSGMDEPLYFGALQYFDIGQADTKISILAGEDTVMTALTDAGAWRIEGRAENSIGEYALDASFAVSTRLPSPVPAGKDHIIAGGELLFYSRDGLCAITPSGVLDERKVQVRSGRLDALLKKENAADIRLGVYGDYVFLGGRKGVYLLDIQRPVTADRRRYSSHGYEAYWWSGLAADCFIKGEEFALISDGKRLELGEGYVDEFPSDTRPIKALWQSGTLGGKLFCRSFLSLCAEFDGDAAARIYVENDRGKYLVSDYNGQGLSWRYEAVRYPLFTYGTRFVGVLATALRLRHTRGLKVSFENDLDGPWRLKTFTLEYK